MALRLIEVLLPSVAEKRVKEVFERIHGLGVWQEYLTEKQISIRLLVPSEETQDVLDVLEKEFSMVDGFRVLVTPVEAILPRQESVEEEPSEDKEEKKHEAILPSISREELYQDIESSIKFSWNYIILIFLSTIVAAIGILRDNVAIIIGAMVIAPLLGPNVALSLATTLGDIELARKAMKANLMGIFTALFFAGLLGFVLDIDTEISEITSRTEVGLGDIALALAAGAVAGFSFTAKAPSALIGVMVAVALLPPVVVLGMLIGSWEWDLAGGALLLLLTNIIGINLSGVVAFLAQGVRPVKWWEADKAKKATRIAIVLWTLLLMVLVVVILLAQRS